MKPAPWAGFWWSWGYRRCWCTKLDFDFLVAREKIRSVLRGIQGCPRKSHVWLITEKKLYFNFFYFTSWHPNLSHYIIIMGITKRGKNLRDSLRKLDASKDKGRVFGGVSHFVLRVRNLSDLLSYLGNATLRTLREGDGDILPLFPNLGRGSLCNMVNTLCPSLQTKEKQWKN